jgi:hypothetical protein
MLTPRSRLVNRGPIAKQGRLPFPPPPDEPSAEDRPSGLRPEGPLCLKCGAITIVSPGRGPHHARADCPSCKAWRWLPRPRVRSDVERIGLDRDLVEKSVKTRSDVSCLPKRKTRGASNTGVLEDAREEVTRGGGRRRATLIREGYPHAQS